MPNWCKNRVTVWSGMSDTETDQLNRIKEIFESKDTVFGKIIPSPDWANIPNEIQGTDSKGPSSLNLVVLA